MDTFLFCNLLLVFFVCFFFSSIASMATVQEPPNSETCCVIIVMMVWISAGTKKNKKQKQIVKLTSFYLSVAQNHPDSQNPLKVTFFYKYAALLMNFPQQQL